MSRMPNASRPFGSFGKAQGKRLPGNYFESRNVLMKESRNGNQIQKSRSSRNSSMVFLSPPTHRFFRLDSFRYFLDEDGNPISDLIGYPISKSNPNGFRLSKSAAP